jgi:NAD(P)-dependent dehydrogenase (short-subunit alcohol dehydrogenase family)
MRALVTGGMSGIGAATVARLRGSGYDVVVWDRTDGADVIVDVSDPVAVDRAAAALMESGPAPEYVVINAGVGGSGLLIAETPAEWDRVLGVNLTGAWLTLRAAAGAMVAAGVGGSIVVVTSISGTLVDRNMGAYCVSKAGADMLAKVAAVELGEARHPRQCGWAWRHRHPAPCTCRAAARVDRRAVRADRTRSARDGRRRGRGDRLGAWPGVGHGPGDPC